MSQWAYPVNSKHLYNICTTSAQRLRRWSDIVQMSYKCACAYWVVTDQRLCSYQIRNMFLLLVLADNGCVATGERKTSPRIHCGHPRPPANIVNVKRLCHQLMPTHCVPRELPHKYHVYYIIPCHHTLVFCLVARLLLTNANRARDHTTLP